jgi:prevent-host-death family protein
MAEFPPSIRTVPVSEARQTLPALVEFVQSGTLDLHEVVLTKHGFPVARLVSYKNRTESGLFPAEDDETDPFGG